MTQRDEDNPLKKLQNLDAIHQHSTVYGPGIEKALASNDDESSKLRITFGFKRSFYFFHS